MMGYFAGGRRFRLKPSFAEVAAELPFVPYIRFADYAVREAGWSSPHRRLLDYLLIYVQEGTCRIELDGVPYTCQEGDFCLIQPNIPCALLGVTNTITPFAHFDLFYRPERELSFMTSPGQTDLSEYRHLLQPRLNDLAQVEIPVMLKPAPHALSREALLKLIGLWQNGDMIGRLEAHQLLGDMMLGLLKAYSELAQDDRGQKPQSLNWITAYLSYSLSEPLSLQDLARRARLSPSRFAAVFKEKFGTSPHRYLLHMRIQHAQKLILNGEYTLEDIARFCGFSDAAHFSKMFKSLTGETPGSYRKTHEQFVPRPGKEPSGNV